MRILQPFHNVKTIYFAENFNETIGDNSLPKNLTTIKFEYNNIIKIPPCFIRESSVKKIYYGCEKIPVVTLKERDQNTHSQLRKTLDSKIDRNLIDILIPFWYPCPELNYDAELICYFDYEARGYVKNRVTGDYELL